MLIDILPRSAAVVAAFFSLVTLALSGCSDSRVTEPTTGLANSAVVENTDKADSAYRLASPDHRIELELTASSPSGPLVSVNYDGVNLLELSSLGLLPVDADLVSYKFEKKYEDQIDTRWAPVWGQSSEVRDHHHSLTLDLQGIETDLIVSRIEIRVYNEGIAFRYMLDGAGENDQQYKEHTAFEFAQDYALRSYQIEHAPFQQASLNQVTEQPLKTPLLLMAENSPVVAIQEAALIDNGPMTLYLEPEVENALGVDVPDIELTSAADIADKNDQIHQTAWRVIQIADRIDDLLLSDMLVNLSPPSRIENTDWIKTGKSLWDWRVRGARYEDHEYALDNASLQRMIDFAATHNMQYVMIDANWYGPEHEEATDPFSPIPDLDIKGLIASANDKDVGFILYLNDKASINNDLDKLFETYSSWGAAGIKYGFMTETGKEKVAKTLNIVELAAKHKLVINFHDDPIAPTGLRRTWPNWLTREFNHAQTDAGRTFSPTEFLEMVNLNMLAGPLDMSNGFFLLDGLPESRSYVRENVHSTVASEVARALIVFSGLIILPDAPEEYLRKQDLFEFLQEMPATWDESIVLSNDLGQHIVMARRSGDQWFLGAAANEQGGTVSLSLDFLDPDTDYLMSAYADSADAHYQTNPEAYLVSKEQITGQRPLDITLDITMAPGGGQAIWFRPVLDGTGDGAN